MKDRDEPQDFEFGPGHPVSASPVRPRSRRAAVVAGVVMVALLGLGAYLYLFEPERTRRLLEGTGLEPPPTTTTVYKWQDAEGNWQLTDRAPDDGTPFEVLDYRSDTNVMPLVPRED